MINQQNDQKQIKKLKTVKTLGLQAYHVEYDIKHVNSNNRNIVYCDYIDIPCVYFTDDNRVLFHVTVYLPSDC